MRNQVYILSYKVQDHLIEEEMSFSVVLLRSKKTPQRLNRNRNVDL